MTDSRRRWFHHYQAPLGYLTAQVCAVALLVMAAGFIAGAIGALAYAVGKALGVK